MVAITHPGFVHPLDRPARLPDAVYRRRRLAVAGALLVLVALASMLLPELASGRTAVDRAEPIGRVSVTVSPGDTIWSIASDLAPGDDPRPVVDAIVEANGGATLVPGQRLDVTLP